MTNTDSSGSGMAQGPGGDGCGGLAERLMRRDRAIRAVHGLAAWGGFWLGGVLIAAALLDGWGDPVLWGAAGAWGVLLAAAAGWAAFRHRRTARGLLWLADRQVAAEEQLITAHELTGANPAHPMLPALLRRCEPLLRRVDVRRLLPAGPGQLEAAAGLFLALALALHFAIPPLSDRVAQMLPRAEGALAEQGRRLERLAGEWEALAIREGFRRLGTLAEETRQAAMLLRQDNPSREEGVRMLLALAGRADALAANVAPAEEAAAEGRVGQVDSPGADATAEVAQASGAFVARGVENSSETVLPAVDLGEERAIPADSEGIPVTVPSPWSQDLSARAENLEQTPSRRNLQETYLVSMAAEELRQAARELNRQIAAAEGTPSPAPPRENAEAEMAGLDDLAPPGEMRPTDEGEAFGPAMPGDIGRFGELDQTASGSSGGSRPSVKPREVGYVDQSVQGRGESGVSEKEWVEREPQPEQRRTPLEPFRAQLQRATLSAGGRGDIPREYWPLLKAYHENLRAAAAPLPLPAADNR